MVNYFFVFRLSELPTQNAGEESNDENHDGGDDINDRNRNVRRRSGGFPKSGF